MTNFILHKRRKTYQNDNQFNVTDKIINFL